MDDKEKHVFTEDDLYSCWDAHATYLVQILNREYDLDEAKEDLLSLIGSKYDSRIN